MKKKILLVALFISLVPFEVLAQSAVIGQDSIFVITPMTILTTGTPEADVFNYFFTLQIYAGMVGMFIRVCLRVLRL